MFELSEISDFQGSTILRIYEKVEIIFPKSGMTQLRVRESRKESKSTSYRIFPSSEMSFLVQNEEKTTGGPLWGGSLASGISGTRNSSTSAEENRK
ncbi:hypothetical protein AVEN_36220-1 [Araneus ventricosus]|uniref:Uncharacterized protein n=1 Tax=Araneus ventricosus TaxID=182803 RepID=A0A4Y2QKF2_ARAVE|nr:hypothetical protein AVEN_36220-1 [Araneus ventricosus]